MECEGVMDEVGVEAEMDVLVVVMEMVYSAESLRGLPSNPRRWMRRVLSVS